jgi:hypothetical protein
MTEKLQPTTPIEPEAGLRAGTGKATEEHDAEGHGYRKVSLSEDAPSPDAGGRFPRVDEPEADEAEGHRFRGGLTEDAPEAEAVAKATEGTIEPDGAGKVRLG